MSKTNVQKGFIYNDPVDVSVSNFHPLHVDSDLLKAETFSAQEAVKTRLSQKNALSELEDLMDEIFVHRAEQVPAIPCVMFSTSHRALLTKTPYIDKTDHHLSSYRHESR